MKRIIHLAPVLITALVFLATPVIADDCSSLADCQNTGAFKTGVAVVGGGLAIGIGIYASTLGQTLGVQGALAGAQTGPGPGSGTDPQAATGAGLPEADIEPVATLPPGAYRDAEGYLVDPSLVDPWDGEPMILHDGAWEEGQAGMVWWGVGKGQDGWVTRQEAIELVGEGRQAIAQRQEEVAIHHQATRENLGDSFQTMREETAVEAAMEKIGRARRDAALSDYGNVRDSALRRDDWALLDRLDLAEDETGAIDPSKMERIAEIARDRIQRDVAAPDGSLDPSWMADFVRETVDDAAQNPVIRVGAGVLSGGSSEVAFQGYAVAQELKEAAERAADQGQEYTAWQAFGDGLSHVARENLPVNTINAIKDGRTSPSELAAAMAQDGLAVVDVLDTGTNMRGSLNQARRGGSARQAVMHKDPESAWQALSGKARDAPDMRPPWASRAGDVDAAGRTVKGIPEEIPPQWGMPRENAIHMKSVADAEGVTLRVRPSNPGSPARLAQGDIPKPPGIKWKTGNELDRRLLGGPIDGDARVAVWEPPPLEDVHQRWEQMPEVDPVTGAKKPSWSKVQGRHHARSQQFAEFQKKGTPDGFHVDEQGLIRDHEGRAVTGDHDVFEVLDHNGKPLEDSLGYDGAKAVKDRVIRKLGQGEARVQHGAHQDLPEFARDQYYRRLGMDPDNLPTDPDTPVPVFEMPEALRENVYDPIASNHAPGGGEQLIEFAPGKDVTQTWGTRPLTDADMRAMTDRGFLGRLDP